MMADEPSIAVATVSDAVVAQDFLLLPPQAPPADLWKRDEYLYADRSHPSVYIPLVDGGVRARSEIVAQQRSAACKFLKDLAALCFDSSMSPPDRALAIIQKTVAEVKILDSSKISELFMLKGQLLEKALSDVERDVTVPPDQLAEIYKLSKTVNATLVRFDCLLCEINNTERTLAAIAAGEIKSDKDASWRWLPDSDVGDLNGLQKLYRLVFDEAWRLDYARYKDSFMRRIVTPEGLYTNAWEKVMTYKAFAYSLTRKPDGFARFLVTRTVNVVDQMALMLANTQETSVPHLHPDRHVFAFRNGCYMAKDELFVRYNTADSPSLPGGRPCPTACKYHDTVFDEAWLDLPDPVDIPTPNMDKIMDTQLLSPDVKRCYYALLGRGIYEIRELDNWQGFLYIKGQANTGKSTLFTFVSSFYSEEDVGVLANNIEEKFGASMLKDKFLVIADDLGEKFTLDQQVFQSMVSGNAVSLPQKNKEAFTVIWRIPVFCSGNVLPGYKDNSGSFSRRLFIINYTQTVARVDTTLSDKLRGEVAAAICKCNRMYKNMVRRLTEAQAHGVTFWEAIPKEFMRERLNAAQCSNVLVHFLQSGKLVYGPRLYMPWDHFCKELQTHCVAHGMDKPRMIPTFYEGTFVSMGLRVALRCPMPYPRHEIQIMNPDKWVVGCDFATADALVRNSATPAIAAATAVAPAAPQDDALDRADLSDVLMRSRAAPPKRARQESTANHPPAQRPRI